VLARALVSDEMWAIVEPLLPTVPRRYRFPGRKRIDDRRVLTGILFVLQTGTPGSTCRRRWAAARA
jgi:transposase